MKTSKNILLSGILLFFILPVKVWTDEDQTGLEFEISPVIRYRYVEGDEDKFRETQWNREGWIGGVENFILEKSVGEKWMLQMQGAAIIPEENYQLRLNLDSNSYYLNAGYTAYRKYFDDTGGYFRLFSIPAFDLSGDLHLDIGRFQVEAGVTQPNMPRVSLRYEQTFKDGKKSLLEWGGVAQEGLTRNIYPASKQIDEQLDRINLTVDHRIGKVEIIDQLQYEKYQTETRRHEKGLNLDAAASETVDISESYNHDGIYNKLRVERRIKEYAYVSLGYFYSDQEGGTAFHMNTVPFGPEPFDKNWRLPSAVLSQKNHIINASIMLGPYRHFSVYSGIEADYMESEGSGRAILTETLPDTGPVSPDAWVRSRTNKSGFVESLGIRFSGVPNTSIWAESKWSQQDIDLFESEIEDIATGFERLTDSDIDRQRYTLGISSSPFRRVTLFSQYRWRRHDNNFQHAADTETGYSAFIRGQKQDTHEFQVKVSARLRSWMKTAFQFKSVRTAFDTLADASAAEIETGDYEANIYSLSFTMTPVSGFYFTGLLSLKNIDSETIDNVARSGDYEAEVYTFYGTAGWAMDETSKLTMAYLRHLSDNFQDRPDPDQGLPFGTDNRRNELSVSYTRDMTDQIQFTTQYAFLEFTDAHKDNFDDYTAHTIGMGLKLCF